MNDRLHLFGIRHHGPGSAASLVAALDALQPRAVLIEGPPEADPLIPYAAAPGMRPPLALLAYAVENPARSVFFPLAVFSPEWQAMRWALRHDRPVRFIDWPAAMSLAAGGTGERVGDLSAQPSAEEEVPEDSPPEGDPLDRLARASGHADGEALWNALIETRGAAADVFAAIEVAMTALREDRGEPRLGPASALREARREAHMRLAMRKALNDHEGALAVVVGAWHVPALRREVAVAEDRATLKDTPKTKVDITWVPWTETRLASASGYGAGVTSPGWYGHLWGLYESDSTRVSPEVFAATWQSKVATLLRSEGHLAPTASVIEAARLSVALAAIRGHAVPGLDEMREGTLAALCNGDDTPFRLIEARLVVGQAVGVLDESVPQMPLAADLGAWQRRLRLKPEAVEQDVAVDLRSEAGLAKSILLHRLDLMGVTWGRLLDASAGRGTFREIWRLAWTPELSVKLAEALVYGITIEQASAGAALARAEATPQIQHLANLVRRCILADLSDAAGRSIALLQAAAVSTVDVASLMNTVPSIVEILRYGTARKMPLEALSALAEALIAEINAGVGSACINLDDEAAEGMRQAMAGFDAALILFDNEHLNSEWTRRLGQLVDDASVVPILAGLALRRLRDRSAIDEPAVARTFSRALSPAVAPKAAGLWLEGFLGSSAEVLLQDRSLLGLVDSWLSEQQEEDFVEILPMLRRAFGNFGATERRRLLAEIAKPVESSALERTVPASQFDAPGFEKALPLLMTILGIQRHG